MAYPRYVSIFRSSYMLLIVCGVLFFSTSLSCQSKHYTCCDLATKSKPLWSIIADLPGDRPDEICGPLSTYLGPYGTIAYTDAQTIVAGFHVEYCNGPGEPWSRHTVDLILKIEAETGKVIDRIEWKDISHQHDWVAGDINVLPTHNGQFLVRVGPFLKLFSPEFKEIRNRILITNGVGQMDYWDVQVAHGGQTGFFKRWNRDDPPLDHWFSTDTLEDQLVEAAAPGENKLSIGSDSAVYFTPFGPPSGSHYLPAFVRERGKQQSRPLCPECYGLATSITTDGMLFLEVGPRASFILVSTEGQIIHRAAFGDPIDRANNVATASAAPRFAFSYLHVKVGLFSVKSPGGVVVFDTKAMKAVFELKFNRQLENSSSGKPVAVALSPDGTYVAVLSRRVLKVFQVPH